MRIRIVHPVVRGVLDESTLPPMPDFVEIDHAWLDEGTSSIECRYDEARAVPAVLERIREAAADGVDGILVNCFMDPALEPGREIVRVPLVGPGQASMSLACMLGHTFSVILPAASGAPIVLEQAARYVGRHRLASVRAVEMPVAELHDQDRLIEALVEQARLAVEVDHAHVVILGCTGMGYVTASFKEKVEELGLGVPVIDPTLAAVAAVVAQAVNTVAHSERTYLLPSWRATEVV